MEKDIIRVSYGNDSIALIQWLHEHSEQPGICLFNDTGWASKEWEERVQRGVCLARKYGYTVRRIFSIGMKNLVRQRKGWPSNQYQFCTAELKIFPALEWLDKIDPNKEAVCIVGVRREESYRRRDFPEWTEVSEKDGGRSLWAPLVRVTEKERNELVRLAGFEVLPHRSKECFPCVNANRADLQLLTEERIQEIADLEKELGNTSKGNPRFMFRPNRFGGARGIREVKAWADKPDGRSKEARELKSCDSGWCST